MNRVMTYPQHLKFPAISRWTKRSLLWLPGLLILLLVAGTIYETVAGRRDAQAFPPPGQMVDVGSHHLHLYCTGPETDGPTIILNHGGGGFGALDFSLVQPEIAQFARVCAYDRAGYGWSEASPNPPTAQAMTDELRTLLQQANIQPPYLLMAHSLGAYPARMYASQHPEEVVGLVLVDGSHENTWSHAEIRAVANQFGTFFTLARLTEPVGVWRLLGETAMFPHPLLVNFPGEFHSLVKPITYQSRYLRAAGAETSLANMDESAAQVAAGRRSLGSLPLHILSADAGFPTETYKNAWQGDHADLLGLSTNARHTIVPDADHISILTQYSPVVVESVRQMMQQLSK